MTYRPRPEDHFQVFQEAKRAGKLGKRADETESETHGSDKR